jgi:hypothetical protein
LALEENDAPHRRHLRNHRGTLDAPTDEPQHSGSVCGRGPSANPASTIGFERRHNRALQFDSEDAFAADLVEDIPPTPPKQAEIVAANRAGRQLSNEAEVPASASTGA